MGVGLWIGIVLYGSDIAKNYIDTALSDMEMRNYENHVILEAQNKAFEEEIQGLNNELVALKESIASLNEEILLFALEVTSLKEGIDVIDSTIKNSIEIQEGIGEKIQALDNRLKELRNSLNVLLEAPNE